jgi:hypothetical protein
LKGIWTSVNMRDNHQYLCCNIKLYIFSMNTLEELQNVGQKSETSQANLLKTCVSYAHCWRLYPALK